MSRTSNYCLLFSLRVNESFFNLKEIGLNKTTIAKVQKYCSGSDYQQADCSYDTPSKIRFWAISAFASCAHAFDTGVDSPEFAIPVSNNLILDEVTRHWAPVGFSDCGNMDKYIPAAIIGRDETKPPIFFPSF